MSGDQRGLARAREADDGDELALLDREVDVGEHLGPRRALAVALGQSGDVRESVMCGLTALGWKVKADCSAYMTRSSRKPMMPMVSTATMIAASESEEPFWNSSQTNLPRPGFCASISAAISTIQPTPSDRRRPVKISGSAEGSTSLRMLGQRRELQHPADIDEVLVDRGDAERGVDQRRPQRAERHRDRRDHAATSAWRR